MIFRKLCGEIRENTLFLSAPRRKMPGLALMEALVDHTSSSQADSNRAAWLPHTQLIYHTGGAGRRACFYFGSDFPLDLQHDPAPNIPKCLSVSVSLSLWCKRTAQRNAGTLCLFRSTVGFEADGEQNRTSLEETRTKSIVS